MTLKTVTRGGVWLALVLGAWACPPVVEPCTTGAEETCEPGTLPPDRCNSPDEARTDPACALTLCQDRTGFISETPDAGADVDFYSVTVPATLTARSLLTVKGGYAGVPQTAVNFSVNVLRVGADGGLQTVATGADRRMGASAPTVVELTQPFTEANAALVVRVSDVGGVVTPRVDNRNEYTLSVCTLEDPDTNEPNDTTPTPIALTTAAGVQQGSSSGYLATNDDLDRYTFAVTGGPRQVIFLRLSSTQKDLMPRLRYLLAFTLKDPTGRPIAEGAMEKEFVQVELSTARLSAGDGTYTLEVFGARMPQQLTPVEGDLRLKYDVDVRVLPDLDSNEPNDTAATARSVNLALGTPSTLTGRLAFVPDEEWFRLNLPMRTRPAVLRYELLPAGPPGRFPPLTTIPSRQLRLLQEVTTGATLADKQAACAGNVAACPRSFTAPTSKPGQLVTALCRVTDPPQCLLSERNEEQIVALRSQKNFVGAIPVPVSTSAVLVAFSDTGRGRLKYADDREWSIRVTLEDDPDEGARTFPVAPIALGPTTSEVSGVLTFGYGKTIDFQDLNEGRGIRGPNDYDATETDQDLFRFTLGGPTDGGAPGDQSWALEWTMGHVDGGSAPAGQVVFESTFCSAADAGCIQSVLRPLLGNNTPWYLMPATLLNQRVLFTQSVSGNTTTIRAEPVACACIPAQRVAAGSFTINVTAVDRTANDPIPYRLRQSVSSTVGTFANPDGGPTAFSCPARALDGGGGCRFLP